ncbi:MAG: hypothetical protein M3R08_05950, partial [Bacteroidota bacterium]|nr:hypothetical protein [Bacteroidota bacterium]
MRNLLFEFEDLSWFPSTIRQGMVDYLAFFLRKTGYYQPIVPLLARGLEQGDTTHIIDLCSGGGGPIPEIHQALKQLDVPVTITLTDKFPNVPAWQRLHDLTGVTIT